MDSGVKPGQALPRTNWTSSPTVRRLCVRSSSSGSSACSGSACPADVRSAASLLSPAVESGLRARNVCAETAAWLRGVVAAGASPLWAPRSGRGGVEVQAFALAQDVVQDVHRPWRHGHIELPEGGRGGGRGALRQRGVERARARLHHCPSWLVGYSERQVQRATKATETSGSKLEDRPVVRVPCTSPRGGLFTPVY